MMTAVCLAFASVGAIFAFTKSGIFLNALTDAKLVCIVAGVTAGAHFHEWRMSPLAKASALFIACLVPPLFFTSSMKMSIFGYPGVYYGSVMTTVLCAAGAVMAEQLEEGREMVYKTIMAAGSMTIIICLAQSAGVDPFHLGLQNNRAAGFLGSPVDAGAILVVLMTFAPPATVPAYILAILTTVSRGAWLGAAMVFFPVRWRASACAIGVGLSILFTLDAPTVSDHVRHLIWVRAAQNISILGSGPATFSEVFKRDGVVFVRGEGRVNPAHAHNAILDALVTKGVLGIVGLIVLAVYSQELAGLWAINMFNPVSFEVVFVACVLLGLERGRSKGGNPAGDVNAKPALEKAR